MTRFLTGFSFSAARRLIALAAAVFALSIAVPPVLAQDGSAPGDAGSDDTACQAGDLNLASAESSGASEASSASEPTYSVPATGETHAIEVTPQTEAEATVQDMLAEDGVHVVHFWAPWCGNARNEMEAGWASLIRDNPDVSFTFVSVWNDAESGASVLQKYDIPQDQITMLQQPDLKVSESDVERRRTFLGIPMTWSPSTWVFHNNGELAFAMNYGEMKMETIQTLIDATQKDW